MSAEHSILVGDALAFALGAHAGQTRKGTDVPYVTHCLRVAALVIENGGDEGQTAAGLLHDTLEDCEGVSERGLRERFGEDVTAMVVALTDTLPGDTPDRKSPWHERKRVYVARLGTLGARTLLVSGCDKLDNLRALVADLEREGVQTLDRFSATPRQTRWYYETVRAALHGVPPSLTCEHDDLLARLATFVPEASIHP